MNSKKYMLALVLSLGALSSCNKDDIDKSRSVIVDPVISENDYDKWLYQTFLEPYNIQVKYQMKDNETDMSYHLTPAEKEKAIQFSHLLKYLCLDVYDKVTGSTSFVRGQFPKIVQLVGSPAYNNNGTIVQGTAEGGHRMNIYNVNALDITKPSTLNDRYFHTMHHEFGHIQNQKRPYPVEFAQITRTDYVANTWNTAWDPSRDALEEVAKKYISDPVYSRMVRAYNTIKYIESKAESERTPREKAQLVRSKKQFEDDNKIPQNQEIYRRGQQIQLLRDSGKLNDGSRYTALLKGFITPYASMNDSEDFVEIQSTYITETEEIWNALMLLAGNTGKEIIEKKLKIVRDYLQKEWNVDLDKLRDEVQERQKNVASQDLNTITLK